MRAANENETRERRTAPEEMGMVYYIDPSRREHPQGFSLDIILVAADHGFHSWMMDDRESILDVEFDLLSGDLHQVLHDMSARAVEFMGQMLSISC